MVFEVVWDMSFFRGILKVLFFNFFLRVFGFSSFFILFIEDILEFIVFD